MITRRTACDTLKNYVGQDLFSLAKKHNVTVIAENGNINKGWKGLTLERVAGLRSNNKKAPNGLGWELKTASYVLKNGMWAPKETMAITMIKCEDLEKDDFFHSHLWNKMKSLIFCAVAWNGKHSTNSSMLKITAMDFLETDELINEVKKDYEFIRNKLKTQGKEALTSKDGKYVQARTKGPGHGSTSRAFYVRRCFLGKICPPFTKI